MSRITGRLAPAKVARITGGPYLAYVAAMVLADMPGHIGPGATEQRHADPRAELARA